MQNGLIQQLSNLGLPQHGIITATFYIVAGITVFFAICVVLSRNIFHSAVFLAITLMGVAGVYLYLDAEFLAITQILIYVGAIVVLFLFAIMLTARMRDRTTKQVNKLVFISALSTLAFLFLFIKVIMNHWQSAGPVVLPGFSIEQLGKSLMTVYVLPFEVISLILLVVLVGAIVIAKSEKE